MSNFTPLEQHARNAEFERIAKCFNDVPLGKRKLLKKIGDISCGLGNIINEYYLPNIRNGEITVPDDINLMDTEKIALIPVFTGERDFVMAPNCFTPTRRQLKNNGIDEDMASRLELDARGG